MALFSKKITLVSSDGENFEVEEEVAKKSQTINHLIEDVCDDYVIPVPNVTSKILSMVLEYCKKHVDAAENEQKIPAEELEAWDDDFVKVDQKTLFDVIQAANYLNIKELLDMTCRSVADMMRGKTPEEIRETFDIKSDYTAEEEEDIRSENTWAWLTEVSKTRKR